MHKEILEQPSSIERMLRGRLDDRFGTARLDGLNLAPRELRGFRRVKILGCGSAYYVGQIGAAMIEELARIPADAEPASEFRYRNPIIEPDTLYVAVSQSGETADTAFAVREVKRKGGQIIGLVNVVGLDDRPGERRRDLPARRAGDRGGLDQGADPHGASASRCWPWPWAGSGTCPSPTASGSSPGCAACRPRSRRSSPTSRTSPRWPSDLAAAQSLFFIGRVRGYPVAREGAQKFKEISYRHAEAYQASELKHGPLALIDEDLPTVAIVPDDELTDRNLAAVQQIVARNGPIIGHHPPRRDAGRARTTPRIVVPKNERELDPILLTVPLQLLAYHAALALGHDIDKPRNLAKSVTVE